MKIYLDTEDEEFESLFQKIAQNVKKQRKQKNITQEQLALAIGHTSASMISKIEAQLENKHYNIKQLYLISKVLGVPLDKLFR
jgi:transcriptional regulator with XRE-family HTH domain